MKPDKLPTASSDGQRRASSLKPRTRSVLTPDLLYNLSFTTEKQEQWAESLRFARQYLEAKGEALTVKDGDEVRGRIARLDALLAARTAAPTPNPPAATLQTPPRPRHRQRSQVELLQPQA